jgi:hypothetical protein
MKESKRPDQEFYENHKEDIDFYEKHKQTPDGYSSPSPFTDFRYAVEKHSRNRLKKELYRHPGQVVKNLDEKGYGVITTMPIKKGEIVEECVVAYETIEPGWEYLDGQMYARNQNILGSYRFQGPKNVNEETKGKHANCWVIAFGNACIYNHSLDCNLIWYHKPAERLMVFIARKDIEAGEELCHNYTGAGESMTVEEYNKLIGNANYHPQFMRDPNKPAETKPAPALIESKPESKPIKIKPTVVEEFNVNENNIEGKVSDVIDPEPPKIEKDINQKPYTHPDKFELPDDVNEDWEPPNKGKKADPKAFLKQAETKKNYTIFKDKDKE